MRDVKIVRWNLWSCPNSFHPQFLRFMSPLMRESLSQHNESTRSTNWRQEIMNFIRSMLKPSFFINSFISFGKRNWKKSKKYDFQLFKLFFFSSIDGIGAETCKTLPPSHMFWTLKAVATAHKKNRFRCLQIPKIVSAPLCALRR